MGAGLLTSLAAAGALLALVRRGFVLDALVGVVAAIAEQFFCPHAEGMHLIMWHGRTTLVSVGVDDGAHLTEGHTSPPRTDLRYT